MWKIDHARGRVYSSSGVCSWQMRWKITEWGVESLASVGVNIN